MEYILVEYLLYVPWICQDQDFVSVKAALVWNLKESEDMARKILGEHVIGFVLFLSILYCKGRLHASLVPNT
jgi:hypothetical protein